MINQTQDQNPWNRLNEWLDQSSSPVCCLTGGAGTGKTTLINQVVAWAQEHDQTFALTAPTGRAARVIKERTGHDASTIHSRIYSLRKIDIKVDARTTGLDVKYSFPLRTAESLPSLIVVDEASMVGNLVSAQETFRFGSGKLLDDLLQWSRVLEGSRTKILFVGDPAQLPPVHEDASPALDVRAAPLRQLNVTGIELERVYRQAKGSVVLSTAQQLRAQILSGRLGRVDIAPGGDMVSIQSHEVANQLLADIQRTIVVCCKNKTALLHNRAIRERRWGTSSPEPIKGDRLLVVRNSRYGLMNGDIVTFAEKGEAERRVIFLSNKPPIELCFRSCLLEQGDATFRVMMLENLLDDHDGQASRYLNQAIMADFERRTCLDRGSKEYMEALCCDPYVSALHVKYGYAMTCHKAQGGEWPHVIVHFDISDHRSTYHRWCYTAITRTTDRLSMLNPPDAASGLEPGRRQASSCTGA